LAQDGGKAESGGQSRRVGHDPKKRKPVFEKIMLKQGDGSRSDSVQSGHDPAVEMK
jgi:hypothetical protein